MLQSAGPAASHPGRTVYIHFTVRVGNLDYVTSQLYFSDEVADDIINNYADYSARGPRDTTNATDAVIAAEEVPNYTLSVARMTDGVMQAWKTLVIRSSLDAKLCQVKGGVFPGDHPGPNPGEQPRP